MHLIIYVILACISLLHSTASEASGSAQMMLFPTRVMLEGNSRYATVTIKNSGDATGRYRISLVDTIMREDGALQTLPEGQRDPFSAADILRISPRSMTIPAGGNQNVRILARKSADLAQGEYRTHLQVKMTDSNVEASPAASPSGGTTMAIQPKLVMVIPVIVRHGTELQYDVSIAGVKLSKGAKPQAEITFTWEGNRSSMGNVTVTHIAASGEETVLAMHPGIAIYRGTTKRQLQVPLEVPGGLSFNTGRLRVTYQAQEDDGGALLASYEEAL